MGARKTTERSVQRVSRMPSLPISAFYIRLAIVGVVIVVGAIFIGRSDTGQINVANTIQNSNQENIDAGRDPIDNVANVPEAFRELPNGGLVPQEGVQPTPTPTPEPTPEESASTTNNEATEPETAEDGEVTIEGNTEEATTSN